MARNLSRVALILLLPFALSSCILAPGRFVSTLFIGADRSFTFTYQGEVIAIDPEAFKSLGDHVKAAKLSTTSQSTLGSAADKLDKAAPDTSKAPDGKKVEAEAKNKAIADALSKEVGYRKVEYLGDGKFMMDYAISGTLTHDFLWPYNLDAQVLLPFVVLEVRANNTVRLQAPGFAKDNGSTSDLGEAGSKMDGTFTLATDAEIVAQNNEAAATTAGGRKSITWKATPLSNQPPTATLRFAGAK